MLMLLDKLPFVAVVAIGAMFGAVFRYKTYVAIDRWLGSPHYATFIVNIVGSFLVGWLFVILSKVENNALQLLLMTGLLGSFTTFSTFSMDNVRLLIAGRYIEAMTYLLSQVILGVIVCFIGVKLAQYLIGK